MTEGYDVTNVSLDENIFNDVYIPELNNMAQTQISFGGSSSGKSYFYVAQRSLIDIMNGGRNYLICRKKWKYLRTSVFKEIKKIIRNWGLEQEFKINQTNMEITCIANGYQIFFAGLDDVEQLKSITPDRGVITDVLVEEATQTTRDDIKQLNKRLRGVDVFSPDMGDMPKRMTLLFNPILKSNWIYKEYFSAINWEEGQTRYVSDDLTILKTTYKDNAFLTESDIYRLENEGDEYWYNVYTLGNWGVLGAVIFKPFAIDKDGKETGTWEVRDLTDMIPAFDTLKHGLDFGFSEDPNAYIKSHFDKKRRIIYVFDEHYKAGESDEALYSSIQDRVGRGYLVCDSAEPKSISKLNGLGLRAIGAKKGPDSVSYGIKWLQNCKIIIHIACVRFKQEIEVQQWKKNKDGEIMDVPVGRDDHGPDAIRYAYEEEMTPRPRVGATVESKSYISGKRRR